LGPGLPAAGKALPPVRAAPFVSQVAASSFSLKTAGLTQPGCDGEGRENSPSSGFPLLGSRIFTQKSVLMKMDRAGLLRPPN